VSDSESEPCADLEALAAFIDGNLPPERRPEMIRHLSRCAKCRSTVESVARTNGQQRARFLWRRVAAIAAALAGVAIGYLVIRDYGPWRTRRIEKLAGAMPSAARVVEPRLAGFPWAPLYRTRGTGETTKSPQELMIAGTAGNALREIGDDRSQDALHTAGVAHLLKDERSQGIAKLREAAARAPRDSAVWSDLAAALYCEADARDDKALFHEALAAADHAIRIAPRMPEPYFNRALILEQIGSPAAASEAWRAFLSLDAESGWASEARQRLKDASHVS
jgi:tetratricopeptide (TPR) repeat protein